METCTFSLYHYVNGCPTLPHCMRIKCHLNFNQNLKPVNVSDYTFKLKKKMLMCMFQEKTKFIYEPWLNLKHLIDVNDLQGMKSLHVADKTKKIHVQEQ
jgi:hypothetical protein